MRGREQNDTDRLRDGHRRPGVGVEQQSLDREDVGPVGGDQVHHLIVHGGEALLVGVVRCGAHEVVGDERAGPDIALDDRDATACETGVDAHHPHDPTPHHATRCRGMRRTHVRSGP